ncbi:MAG TPA: efflux RND transporter periplasmic adaptor subunit [Kofleriaceae bacterium]|nr:efflux RND transporter periplasmic adaptor subunit [Kofleriaceae bacterium]
MLQPHVVIMKPAAWLAGSVALAGACSKDGSQPSAKPPPIEVGVVEIEPQRVLLTTELPGRTSAFRVAEVRARVDGIVLKRLYREGGDVRQGQQLFQIDPAPFEAALQRARAQFTGAQSSQITAKLLAERYAPLIKTHAISRQDYDNAIAQARNSVANVAAARADVRTAEINLGYTRVYAPIAGRSARSNVTEGAYVQQAQATLLTTVTQLDPIYVDTTWSTTDLMRVRHELERGQLVTVEGKPKVTVVLEDGSEYAQPGTLLFTGVNVDPTTGSVALRALVPNPRGELLPGMYVQARIEEGSQPSALLVPQRAVTRDRTGQATTLLVDRAGKVQLRPLQVDRAVGDAWLVTHGIAAGDQVIVEGLQRARPGATVKPVPARRSPEVR